MRSTGSLLPALIGLLLGALAPAADRPPAEADRPAWFRGWLVPRRATWLRVPLLGERPLVLERLAADGARVAAGDELAVFAGGPAADRAAAAQRLRSAEAGRERELARLAERLRALRARKALAEIEAAKAELEKKKTGVLSRRDAELVELAANRAGFEVQALALRIQATEAVLAASRAEQDERVGQARAGVERLEERRAAHRLLAPGPGRVWLPPLSTESGRSRPARPGDRLPAGQLLLVLATDEALEVRFWVPEDRADDFRVGRPVTVSTLGGERETFARVIGQAPFPVPAAADGGPDALGRLEVFAELPAGAAGFGPGQSVRVGP